MRILVFWCVMLHCIPHILKDSVAFILNAWRWRWHLPFKSREPLLQRWMHCIPEDHLCALFISYSFTAVLFDDFKADKYMLMTWSEQYSQNILVSLLSYCFSKHTGKFGDTNMELILCCDKYCCIVFGCMCRWKWLPSQVISSVHQGVCWCFLFCK